MLIGAGPNFAWTISTGGTDHWHLFAETLEPSDPSRYWYQGGWSELDCRTEQILVAQSGAESVEICESVHGPILVASEGVAFASANAVRGTELRTLEAWIAIGRARSLEAFSSAHGAFHPEPQRAVCRRYRYIAYWHTGRIPLRSEGVDPLFPTTGTGDTLKGIIVQLGRGPRIGGENILPPGQSADPSSPHFDDQLDLYANWTYKPMRFTPAEIRASAQSVTRLRVAD